MPKNSFGEISAIQYSLDKERKGGDSPGYIIVKTFKQIRRELDAQSKTTSRIVSNGVLQIFEVGLGDTGTTLVDLVPSSAGTENTAARSDHHHKLDEDIAPTWTSPHAWAVPTAEASDLVLPMSLTHTMPSASMATTGQPTGFSLDVTSPTGTSNPTNESHSIAGIRCSLLPGYTGTARSIAIIGNNTVATAGNDIWESFPSTPGVGAKYGIYGGCGRPFGSTNTGSNVAIRGEAHKGQNNYGGAFSAYDPRASAFNCGMAIIFRNSSNATATGEMGLYVGNYGPTSSEGVWTPPNLTTFTYGRAVCVLDSGAGAAGNSLLVLANNHLESVVWTGRGNVVYFGSAIGDAIQQQHLANASQTVDLMQFTDSTGATVRTAVDPQGRARMRETTTPSHVTNMGSVYTKDFAGRTELCYFDSDGAATGVEIRLTNAGSIGTVFANPTASVGLTAVNGSAVTAMRSDAAPPLSQAIAPTMTGTWIWEPSATNATPVTVKAAVGQTVHSMTVHSYDGGTGTSVPFFRLGTISGSSPALELGYITSGTATGYIRATADPTSAATLGASVLGIVITNSLSAGGANAFKISNEAAGRDYMVMGPTGEIAVGYISGLTPSTGIALSMQADTSQLATAETGMLGYVNHQTSSVLPGKICGVRGVAKNSVTTNVSPVYWGLRGDVACASLAADPTVGTTELAAVLASWSNTAVDIVVDYHTSTTGRTRGQWPRVSGVRVGALFHKQNPSFARPLEFDSVYAPISVNADPTTGQSWGVNIDNPLATGGGTLSAQAISGGIRIGHPNVNTSSSYGSTRAMHVYLVPYAITAGGYGTYAKGDMSFDDGTNQRAGLYQYTDAWSKLIDIHDFVSYEDDAVFYEDELVLP